MWQDDTTFERGRANSSEKFLWSYNELKNTRDASETLDATWKFGTRGKNLR